MLFRSQQSTAEKKKKLKSSIQTKQNHQPETNPTQIRDKPTHRCCPHYTPRDFVLSIQRPRSIIILVKAGSSVDQTIAALSSFMELRRLHHQQQQRMVPKHRVSYRTGLVADIFRVKDEFGDGVGWNGWDGDGMGWDGDD